MKNAAFTTAAIGKAYPMHSSVRPCLRQRPHAATAALLGAWLGMAVAMAASAGDASGGGLRLYEAVHTAQPPVIDGRLDEPCWAKAAVGEGFVRVIRDPGTPPVLQTRFQILYDDEALYIGVTCAEPHPERLQAAAIEDGSAAVCGDDSIEMFLQPDPARTEYYHLAANSKGVRYDGCGFDGSWRGDWTAAASVGKEAWSLECRIALASFPGRQAAWRFNICRELRSSDEPEFHCWSDTGGAFHTPARFGRLAFSGAFAGLRRGYLMEAAGLAARSLEREALLANRLQEVERLRGAVTTALPGGLAETVRTARRERAALEQRYAGRTELSIAEWQALNAELDRLLAGLEDLYWELKFAVLFND